MRDRLNDLGNQLPQGGPPSGLVGAVAGVSAVGFVGYNSVFTVEGGQRAVLWSRVQGVKPAVYGEGMHPRIPLIEYPVHFDVRTRPRNVQSLTGSKDLQMVNVTLRVLFYPNKQELPWTYTMLGPDYDARVPHSDAAWCDKMACSVGRNRCYTRKNLNYGNAVQRHL